MDRIFGAIIFLFLAVSFQSFEIASSTEPTEFGGLTPAILDEHERYELLCIAQEIYNQRVDSEYMFKLIRAKNMTQQVVAGIRYRMTVLLEETECKKRDVGYTCEEIHACPQKKPRRAVSCDYTTLEQPWEHFREDIFYNCVPILEA